MCFSFKSRIFYSPFQIGLRSHHLYFHRFAEALKKEGHDAHLITTNSSELQGISQESTIPIKKFNISERTESLNTPEASKAHVDIAVDLSLFGSIRGLFNLKTLYENSIGNECEQLLNNTDNWNMLVKENYDFIILDIIYPICHTVIPFKLSKPYAFLGIPTSPMSFRVPSLPSFVPNRIMSSNIPMSFKERTLSFLSEIYLTLAFRFGFTTKYFDNYLEGEKPISNIHDSILKASAWFYLEEQLVNLPQARMPNTIDIGEVIIQDTNPLSKEWSTLIDSISRPIVIVSLGSFCSNIPKKTSLEFCKAFTAMRQFFFIWKVNELDLCKGENIYSTKWIPQKELLSNNKVKVFVTHAGLNSIIETSYYGIPVVSIPIFADQVFNAKMAENNEFGITVFLSTLTSDSLIKAITEINETPKYLKNIKEISNMLKMKFKSSYSMKKVTYVIDHVIKYGDKKLKSSAFQLNLIQFFMIDVIFVIFISLSLAILTGIFCTCYFCKRCICKRFKVKKE